MMIGWPLPFFRSEKLPAFQASIGHGSGRARGAARPLALLGEEEEGLVAPVVQFGDEHRTAHGAAELILLERAQLGAVAVVAPRVGFQFAVAQEVEGRAVQPVGARLGGDRDHAAAGAPELGRKRVRDDGDLFHRVHDGLVAGVLDADVVLGHDHRGAVDRDFARCVAAAAEPGRGTAAGKHAGNQRRQAIRVPSVQRKIDHRLVGDDRRNRRRAGVELRRAGVHFHRGGDLADLHREIQFDGLLDAEADIGGDVLVEARPFPR